MASVSEHRKKGNASNLRSMNMDQEYWDSYPFNSPSQIRRWESDQRTRTPISQTSLDESPRSLCPTAPVPSISSPEGQRSAPSNLHGPGLDTDDPEERAPLASSRPSGVLQRVIHQPVQGKDSREDRNGQTAEIIERSWDNACDADILQLLTTSSSGRRSVSTLGSNHKPDDRPEPMEENHLRWQVGAADTLSHNNDSTEDLFW